LLIGMARLIGGWLAVRRMRSHSRRLQEPVLREEVEILQAEIGCAVPIELRESIRLATAATVGWRQPIVLLPAGWKEWTPLERRAVLAHEIAHIHHRDYLAWLFAQISVVLHFYHPLVHWLAGRLRIDQELAADAAAAPLAGGRQTYLETLAQLALRHSDRRLSWPIRAFLPTRHTFLRRLEMLRDPRQLSARSPARTRWLTFGVMLAAGILVAGLRGPGAGNSSSAFAADDSSTTPANAAALSSGYIPRDAALVVGLRPAALLNNAAIKSVIAPLLKDDSVVEKIGVSPEQIEELKVIFLTGDDPRMRPLSSPIVVVRVKQPGDAQLIVSKLFPDPKRTLFDGRPIVTNQSNMQVGALPDERTVIVAGDEPALRRVLIAGAEGSPSSAIDSMWTSVAGDDVAIVGNVEAFGLANLQNPAPPGAAMFAPLWQKTQSAAAGIVIRDRFQIRALANAATAEDAKRIKDTLGALLILGRNTLSGLRASASRLPAEQSAMTLRLADIADHVLEKAEVSQSEGQVTVTSQGDSAEAAKIIATLAPAISSARTAARRSQEMNNLKQIAIALHNYNSAFGHLPASAIVGPDGKTMHSWRVAILPYIDQAPLYNEYKFDEPWDSESNKKILEKMPAVLRSPLDPPDSKNASYFVFTGDHTVFGDPEGTKFEEITDGTSQTLAVVEAKREIPWTKPEDLPYDADKPVPELGGRYEDGFIAAFCDGSVRTISEAIEPQVLRQWGDRADGEIIHERWR